MTQFKMSIKFRKSITSKQRPPKKGGYFMVPLLSEKVVMLNQIKETDKFEAPGRHDTMIFSFSLVH